MLDWTVDWSVSQMWNFWLLFGLERNCVGGSDCFLEDEIVSGYGVLYMIVTYQQVGVS